MKRSWATVAGIAVLAIAAFWIGRQFLAPAEETHAREEPVLTNSYQPKLWGCYVLEDYELPEGLAPPPVGGDFLYLAVVVRYADPNFVPDEGLALEVRGRSGAPLAPVHRDVEHDDEATYLTLVFETTPAFEQGRLMKGDKVVIADVSEQLPAE